VLLIGLACGLGAAVLVRFAVVLLVGGVRTIALLAIIGLGWLALRRSPRRRRDP
jgi:hypothetical protein